MKIDREMIYTKIGPALMAGLAVCLVVLTVVSLLANGWPTTPPSIQTVVLLGHNLDVCIAGLVLARGKLQRPAAVFGGVVCLSMVALSALMWPQLFRLDLNQLKAAKEGEA